MAHNQTTVTRQEADAIAAYLLQLDDYSFAQPTGPTINVALGKVVAQSSLAWGGLVERAVDGNTSGNWRNGEITHTDLEMNPWLELDLGAIYDLSSIRLWNRTDCCIERLTDFEIFVSDKPFTSKSPEQTRAQASVTTIANNELVRVQKTFAIERKARYVRVQITGQGVLSLAELEVMGRALQ